MKEITVYYTFVENRYHGAKINAGSKKISGHEGTRARKTFPRARGVGTEMPPMSHRWHP